MNQAAPQKNPRRRAASKRPLYEPSEVERVLDAYNDVFRHVPTSVMETYWDLGSERRRQWSCLTTNFRAAKYQELRTLHEHAQNICESDWTARAGQGTVLRAPTREELVAKGEALRDAAHTTRVGYSIGLCPWTDNGLHETWERGKDGATILLGHDWYPIVPWKEHPIESPLRSEGLHWVKKYHVASPRSLLDGDRVMIFLNLMPDYRPPAEATVGAFSQRNALPGFLQVLEAVARRFKGNVQVISWGSTTWESLRGVLPGETKRLSLTDCATTQQGRLMHLPVGQYRLDYLPVAHPALPHLNFNKPAHMQHVKQGFMALEAFGLVPKPP